MSAIATTIQEEFSYAYIHAVTAAAGYAFQPPNRQIDNDGIDITIRGVGQRGISRPPVLDAQVKSTSVVKTTDEDSFFYDLDISAYNILRLSDQSAPMILIIVLVPKNAVDWTEQSEDKLCLKKCAYWLSLEGQSESNNKTTIRLKIPRANLLTVHSLREIMQRVKERKKL